MQVYPEPSGSNATASLSSTAGYTDGKPGAAQFTSQPPQPPSYPPPVYQPSANTYGYNPSFATAPAQYGAPVGYAVAPTSYGYPTGYVTPQNQLQNSQNVQVNVVNATASRPVIIAQPAPVVMSPQSYLGWSIFNCLFCFWPLGIAAIIYSVKVGSARNHEQAKSYSLTARNLNIAATTIAPILVIVIVGGVVGVGVVGSAASSNAKYYSYGYSYYYSYLMYYTYYGYYSYLAYSYSMFVGTYSYTDYDYGTVTASKYVTAQGFYYYG